MTAPIEPIRRIQRSRKVDRTPDEATRASDEAAETAADAAARASAPHAVGGPEATAAFTAQLMLGQERRGQRGGPATLDAAKTAYNRVEWSGPADRRAPKGGLRRTDV